MAIELRIALLIIGLVVLAGLYFFGKSKRIAHRNEDEDFNFDSNDYPDPLEIDQIQEPNVKEAQEELNEISDLVRE